jgi:hypothetical protein
MRRKFLRGKQYFERTKNIRKNNSIQFNSNNNNNNTNLGVILRLFLKKYEGNVWTRFK